MSRTRLSFRCLFSIKKMAANLNSKNILKPTLIILITSLLLSSCGSSKKIVDLKLKYIPADRAPAQITDEQAQAQVAEAATAIGQSLQALSAVQMTIHPPQRLNKPFDPHAIGMDKMASIDWTGPAEPILKEVAYAANYRLRVIGKKPALPVLVSINIENQPLADILRNITYQIVMKATVAIYPKSRTIELRYHGN